MKSYYLKRIDELKTEVGSDRPGTPVKSAIMAIASPFLPTAARRLTLVRDKVRKALNASKAKENKKSSKKSSKKPKRKNK
jgi:hypothetical protein